MVNTCPNLLDWLKICALNNYPTVLVSGKLPVSSPPVLHTLEAEDPLVFFSLPYNFSSSSSPSSWISLSHTTSAPSMPSSAVLCTCAFYLLPHSPLWTWDVCLLHQFPSVAITITFDEDVHFLHSLPLFLPYSPLTWSPGGLQIPDTD